MSAAAAAVRVALPATDGDYLGQVLYAMHFCDPGITGVAVDGGDLVVEHAADADARGIEAKTVRLLERYAAMRDVFRSREIWRRGDVAPPPADCYEPLVARGDVVPSGRGRVILRGDAARVLEFLDALFVARVARPLDCTPESYPGCIACADLAHTQHITSFPQHLFFVTHLCEDLDAIDAVAEEARRGWNAGTSATAMRHAVDPSVMLNPSCCYHCYVALRGSDLGETNRAATARTRCHRHEAGNHATLRRLADFTMREVIFVGHPEWVQARRDDAERLMRELLDEIDLDAAFVTANDPFFTNDYKVKAVFQRTHDAKRELTVPLADGGRMAIASSNFHSTTFGRAFDIRQGRRPACSGCYAWGLERWVYAWFLRHGLDAGRWPASCRALWDAWRRGEIPAPAAAAG